MDSFSHNGNSKNEKNDRFNKENAQLSYSLVLIFLIPLTIMANIFWCVYQNQKILNTSTQNQAQLVKSILSSSVSNSLNNNQALQEYINSIASANSQITEITVLKPVENGFVVIASSDNNKTLTIFKSLQYTSVWVDGQDFTSISDVSENNHRSQIVVSQLKDSDGKNTALLQTQIDLGNLDKQNQKNLQQTLVILFITIIFVLLVLINHFKLFKYALLLKRLREVDKMKDDFISMASHELKTPMAAIKGYMGMIFEGVAGKIDTKAKEHLMKVSANVKRLDALINSLLDVSRIEQQRMQFDMQAVDITTTIENIISELQVQADEKKLQLSYKKLPQPRPFIFADPERLGQIFDNVIGNAIKYSLKGKITISHSQDGNFLKTYVQDTGIGMSPVDMRGLFGKFYRIRNEKTADIPGTGLGLWITKEIVNKMNGDITVQSTEGVGTIITIVFPIMKEK